MDSILVEFHVHQPDLQVLDQLVGERAAAERFTPAIEDQFHRLVQVLDTLRHIDEHVGALDRLDVFSLILIHTGGNEGIAPLHRLLVHRDLALLDQLHDLRVHRFEFNVEPVVAVWRLPFDRTCRARDRLAVDNDRRGSEDIDAFVALDTAGDDLEMEFAHAADQVLAGLLVDRDPHRRVFLGHLPENLDELREILHALRLDGDSHDRLGVVLQRLEGDHIDERRDCRADNGVL